MVKKRASKKAHTATHTERHKNSHTHKKNDDTVLKIVFIVLGIALLVAAYYVGYLDGSGDYNEQELRSAMSSNGVAQGQIDKVLAALDDDAAPTTAPSGVSGDKVVITEYSDFECPYCGRFYNDAYKKIKSTYGDKVEFDFKQFPLSFHANAQKAAEASECARDQEKFWEYHDLLFDSGKLAISDLKAHAASLGLDSGKFDSCLDGGEKATIVSAHMQEAQALGIRGTPSFTINGEVIVGAQPFEAFQPKIDAALAGEAAPAPTPSQPTAPTPPPAPAKVEGDITDDDEVKGDPNALVTIVEFSDYECPFCGRHYQQTMPQLVKNYVDTGKVKIVFRDFPLGFHSKAQKAGEAAECAGEQDDYWGMHDKLFDNQQSLSEANYKKWAGELGLDQTEFDDCLDSGAQADEVKADMADGQKYGITGTPGFLINGVKVSGAQPYSVFEAAIEKALAE